MFGTPLSPPSTSCPYGSGRPAWISALTTLTFRLSRGTPMAGVSARRLDLVVVVLLWHGLMAGCQRPSSPALTSLMVPVGDSLQVGVTPSLALSPTGNLLVYVGRRGSVTRLYLKADSGGEARALDGTEGAANPFFSPDGRWVGFFAGGKLKKLPLEDAGSATPTVICDASGPRGASWSVDGTIVFAIADHMELLGVSADGGEPRPLTRPVNQGDFGHRWPQLLPGVSASPSQT